MIDINKYVELAAKALVVDEPIILLIIKLFLMLLIRF